MFFQFLEARRVTPSRARKGAFAWKKRCRGVEWGKRCRFGFVHPHIFGATPPPLIQEKDTETDEMKANEATKLRFKASPDPRGIRCCQKMAQTQMVTGDHDGCGFKESTNDRRTGRSKTSGHPEGRQMSRYSWQVRCAFVAFS